MKVLNIKNSDPYLNSKFVNIVDFSSKKLSAWDVGIKDFCIHYIEYDDHVFYLVLDNLKGFIEVNDGRKCLTMIFSSEDQKLMYDCVWKGI